MAFLSDFLLPLSPYTPVRKKMRINISPCKEKKLLKRLNFSPPQQKKTSSVKNMEAMLIEILLRLPVKSLARFKCVSRMWNSFISSDSYFRTRYKKLGDYPLTFGLFYQSLKVVPMEKLSDRMDRYDQLGFMATTSSKGNLLKENIDQLLSSVGGHEKLYIIATSNGSVLCRRKVKPHPLTHCTSLNYFIYNPITKNCLHLPPRKRIGLSNSFGNVGFVCLERFNHSLQYKVVRAMLHQKDFIWSTQTLSIEIFSSDQIHEWTKFKVTCSFPSSFRLLNDPAIVGEDEVVYWHVILPNTNELGVVVFDQRQEHLQLELIVLPFYDRRGKTFCYFGQTNGLIVQLFYSRHGFDMWVLDKHKKQWSLKYKVENLNINLKKIEGIHPLDLEALFIVMEDGTRAWYNFRSTTLELVSVRPGFCLFFFPYVCNLSCFI